MARGDSKWLERERGAIILHIESAFRGVSRREGMSWSEATADDYDLTDEERLDLRALDTDQRWIDLVDDPAWGDPLDGLGSLDPIGFRYYLPAAMVRCLRAEDWTGMNGRLPYVLTSFDDGSSARRRWAKLDLRQRRVIKRFLEYMIEVCERPECSGVLARAWRKAYESHWRDVT